MSRLRRIFAMVALVLVAAPLAANAPLFDPDEGLHAAIAQEMVLSGDYVTPTFLGEPFLDKPILFFWAEAEGTLAERRRRGERLPFYQLEAVARVQSGGRSRSCGATAARTALNIPRD